MSKKEYTFIAILTIGLALLGFGSLILGAILQDSGSTIVPYGWLIGLFFVFLVAALVILIVYFKKLTKYAFERKYKKHENLETRKLQRVPMTFGEETVETLFGKYRYGKSSPGLYWVFRPNYLTQPMIFVLEFRYNEDMKEEETESKEDSEETEEAIDPKYEELMNQMPKAGQQGYHVRVVFNMLDSVDDVLISQAERIVTNSEILSRTFGMFSPIILYFLYDKSTGTLYYEPYKAYRMYPRPKALKMLLKMLGIPIKQE